jgi:hypothetical protein
MEKQETTEAIAAIGMMLQAFPSAQSSITADSPKVYLFAVEEFELEALKRACRAIVRGEVKDLKPEFPPAAPKLAQIVKEFEGKLKFERYEAENPFVEVGSVIWDKLVLLRKDPTLPSFVRTRPDGSQRSGWNFPKAQIEEADKLALPPPMPAADMAQRRIDLARRGFDVGDPEDSEAAA